MRKRIKLLAIGICLILFAGVGGSILLTYFLDIDVAVTTEPLFQYSEDDITYQDCEELNIPLSVTLTGNQEYTHNFYLKSGANQIDDVFIDVSITDFSTDGVVVELDIDGSAYHDGDYPGCPHLSLRSMPVAEHSRWRNDYILPGCKTDTDTVSSLETVALCSRIQLSG